MTADLRPYPECENASSDFALGDSVIDDAQFHHLVKVRIL